MISKQGTPANTRTICSDTDPEIRYADFYDGLQRQLIVKRFWRLRQDSLWLETAFFA